MLSKLIKAGIFLSMAFVGVSASTPKNASFNSVGKNNINNISKQDSTNFGKDIVWENESKEPIPEWGGTFRFACEGHQSGEEIYIIPEQQWEKIKNETFYIDVELGAQPNIRICDAWWTTNWPGNEHDCVDMLTDNGDGTYALKINFVGYDIQNYIDEQHLLFTGANYTLLRIYFQHYKVLWDNDINEVVDWHDDYRFGYVGGASPERCLALFSKDEWDNIIKAGTFYMDLVFPPIEPGDYTQINVADGWWEKTWAQIVGTDDPRLKDNGDGTYTLTINLAGTETAAILDDHNLMFTGHNYMPIRLYYGYKPMPTEEVAIWAATTKTDYVYWTSTYYRFSNVEDSTDDPDYKIPMGQWERMKTSTFYLELEGENPLIHICDGWWQETWTGDNISPGDERLTSEGDNKWVLKIDLAGDPLVEKIDAQNLLVSGQGYRPLRLYFLDDYRFINNDRRDCVDFRYNAYLSVDCDVTSPGDVVTINVNNAEGIPFTPNDLKVTYNEGAETCELTQVSKYVFTFVMPDADVDITALFDSDYVVSFIMVDRGDPIDPITVHIGSKINKPKDPFVPNYRFVAWYKENTFTHLWDFDNDVVKYNTSLFSKWEEDPMTSVELKSGPSKTIYKYGEDLDLTGAQITVTMASGAVIDTDITPSMISGYKKDKLGEQTLTVSCGTFSNTFTVTVVDYVSNIAMKSNPTKVEFNYGEDLDLTGAQITVHMASGPTEDVDVTLDMISGYDKNKSGKQVITITYEGVTTTFTITVLPAPIPQEVWIGLGGGLGILLLILLAIYLINRKRENDMLNSLLPDGVECIKTQPIDERFDEYKFVYSYKGIPISYFMYKLKTLHCSDARIKKEFKQLVENGEIRKYSNKYYRNFRRRNS